MEREMVGVYGLVALFFLIMLRIPVALAMLVTGIVGTWVLSLVSVSYTHLTLPTTPYV